MSVSGLQDCSFVEFNTSVAVKHGVDLAIFVGFCQRVAYLNELQEGSSDLPSIAHLVNSFPFWKKSHILKLFTEAHELNLL